MRSMHESLRSKHHLFHDARMQYGLFLKGTSTLLLPLLRARPRPTFVATTIARVDHHRCGSSSCSTGIGLTLEDALKFWKSEFTRVSRITPEKFDKEYAYNIRYVPSAKILSMRRQRRRFGLARLIDWLIVFVRPDTTTVLRAARPTTRPTPASRSSNRSPLLTRYLS